MFDELKFSGSDHRPRSIGLNVDGAKIRQLRGALHFFAVREKWKN